MTNVVLRWVGYVWKMLVISVYSRLFGSRFQYLWIHLDSSVCALDVTERWDEICFSENFSHRYPVLKLCRSLTRGVSSSVEKWKEWEICNVRRIVDT